MNLDITLGQLLTAGVTTGGVIAAAATISSRFSKLETIVEKGFEAVKERSSKLEAADEKLDDADAKIREELGELRVELQAVKTKVDAIENKLQRQGSGQYPQTR